MDRGAPIPEALTAELAAIVGAGGWLPADAVAERSGGPVRGGTLRAGGLVRPRSTGEVSAVLRACNAAGQPVVVHGGLTGLVRGADAGPHELVLSLERMREVEEVDPAGRTATAQAGVTLQALQEAAEAHDLMFPLDLGARGSATVGGIVATNAGGNRVVRYGMARDMVLGLEAVLADGTVVGKPERLLKNNSGYDLKQLFIGSEGTLGVVTRAALRLRERPGRQDVALAAAAEFRHVVALLKLVDRALGGRLSAFEVMWRDHYRLVTRPPSPSRSPLAGDHPYCVLVEMHGSREGDEEHLASALAQAHAAGLVVDAVVARSGAERDALWAIRDDVTQLARLAPLLAFDVSVPILAMEGYVEGVRAELARRWPGGHCSVFGHLADGNLHLVFAPGAKGARRAVEQIVYEPLAAVGGAVSAEHGIGLEKKAYLRNSRSADEVSVMRLLKRTLDPNGILNRGKVIDA